MYILSTDSGRDMTLISRADTGSMDEEEADQGPGQGRQERKARS